MSTTHVGKIGRLPKYIRDDLGRRIEDGEPGKELVKWLNGLPRVKEVLQEQFGGRPITEQNLSEWKQGGHQEWLRHQEARVLSAVHRAGQGIEVYDEDDGWSRSGNQRPIWRRAGSGTGAPAEALLKNNRPIRRNAGRFLLKCFRNCASYGGMITGRARP